MNKCIYCLLLLVLVFCTQVGRAQIKVTGVVTDEHKSPLPGVSVLIKGTTQGSNGL